MRPAGVRRQQRTHPLPRSVAAPQLVGVPRRPVRQVGLRADRRRVLLQEVLGKPHDAAPCQALARSQVARVEQRPAVAGLRLRRPVRRKRCSCCRLHVVGHHHVGLLGKHRRQQACRVCHVTRQAVELFDLARRPVCTRVAAPQIPRDAACRGVAFAARVEPLALLVDFVPGEVRRHAPHRLFRQRLAILDVTRTRHTDSRAAPTVLGTPCQRPLGYRCHLTRRRRVDFVRQV